MMEGLDVILGRDWLDQMNPLVDWQSNSMVLRSGDRLEVVSGVKTEKVHSCNIIDRGLPGLQHSFTFLREQSVAQPSTKWDHQLAKLSSPTFWTYEPSACSWAPQDTSLSVSCYSAPRTSDVPQGGVAAAQHPEEKGPQPPKSSGSRTTRARNISGKCVRQPVKTKLDFVSMRQAARRANKTNEPMFLCILRANSLTDVGTKKKQAKAGVTKGRTEGERRRESKETGPVTKEVPVEEVIWAKVTEADPAVRERLQETLEEYRDIFPDKLPYGPPPKRVIDHEIETILGSAPPHKSPYKLSSAELDEMKRQIDTLLEQGWIRPSSSPYGAPILFIPKKDGKWRMCIDYRALNKITVKNRYPLPKVEELMDRLHGAKYFSKIDLASGYHQIRVQDSDIHKRAFVNRYGSFEYFVMPFGLCNAPATFQRVMNTILHDGLDQFVLVFLDDILIFSRTLEEHLAHIHAVLDRLWSEKLYGRLKKM